MVKAAAGYGMPRRAPMRMYRRSLIQVTASAIRLGSHATQRLAVPATTLWATGILSEATAPLTRRAFRCRSISRWQCVMWYDYDANPGTCPDEDGVFDPGEDAATYANFDTILNLTTATASAAFADENFDGCKRAGAGPDGPFTGTGSPAAGPCCAVGGGVTLVSSNAVFDNSTGVVFDRLISLAMPASVTGCESPGPASSCTVTTDVCLE